MKVIDECYVPSPSTANRLTSAEWSREFIQTPDTSRWHDATSWSGATPVVSTFFVTLDAVEQPEVDRELGIPDKDVEVVFDALADAWTAKTRFSSSLDFIFGDPMLSVLLKLGPRVLPLALERFFGEPERWHHVLVELSGVQPLGPDVPRDEAGAVWAEALGLPQR